MWIAVLSVEIVYSCVLYNLICAEDAWATGDEIINITSVIYSDLCLDVCGVKYYYQVAKAMLMSHSIQVIECS